MKTIAIRFSDNFAPKDGTIDAHEKIIKTYGHVWFGKIGNRKISKKVIDEIFSKGPATILMIKTQSKIHYLAKVEAIFESCPEPQLIPEYYRNMRNDCANWFKITEFRPVSEEELKHFYTSSGNTIFDIFKKSMGSYFIVERKGE